MTVDDIKDYYVTWQNCMRKLSLSQNAYQHWQRYGYVPLRVQLLIEEQTNGILKADEKNPMIIMREKEEAKEN